MWLPLSGHSLLKFDVQAAQEWFYKTEGLPYGYHNFLFGWVDTPFDNIPPLMPNEFIPIAMSLLSHVIPDHV